MIPNVVCCFKLMTVSYRPGYMSHYPPHDTLIQMSPKRFVTEGPVMAISTVLVGNALEGGGVQPGGEADRCGIRQLSAQSGLSR